jgi:hypothetical protein
MKLNILALIATVSAISVVNGVNIQKVEATPVSADIQSVEDSMVRTRIDKVTTLPEDLFELHLPLVYEDVKAQVERASLTTTTNEEINDLIFWHYYESAVWQYDKANYEKYQIAKEGLIYDDLIRIGYPSDFVDARLPISPLVTLTTQPMLSDYTISILESWERYQGSESEIETQIKHELSQAKDLNDVVNVLDPLPTYSPITGKATSIVIHE